MMTHEGHAGTHGHDHADGHEHGHDHTHGDEAADAALQAESGPERDMRTLAALIDHWIEHNDSHARSYEEWADKAEAAGKDETAGSIRAAVALGKKMSSCLKTAGDFLKNA